MITINLRDYYPWYTHDEFLEVSDEVAAELEADRRYENAHKNRMYYHNAQYSLDMGDGIETSAVACHNDNPERIFAMMENHCRLCRALNSLPEIQGRRIEAHYLLGMSQTEIAEAEGVKQHSVSESIHRGLRAMRKYILENAESCPINCP